MADAVLDGGTVRCHYWDASALVKIVATDAAEALGRAAVRAFFFGQPLHYATSYCLAEALGAFKLKWLRGHISRDEYFADVREFFRLVVSGLEEDKFPSRRRSSRRQSRSWLITISTSSTRFRLSPSFKVSSLF